MAHAFTDFLSQQTNFRLGNVVHSILPWNAGCKPSPDQILGKIGEMFVQFPETFDSFVVFITKKLPESGFLLDDCEK